MVDWCSKKGWCIRRHFFGQRQIASWSNRYTFFRISRKQLDEILIFRFRVCKKLLKNLDESRATGNDNVSPVILKKLAACIAIPFAILCRRLFYEGCWPTIWNFHSLVPLFKKGTAFKPGNYRGVHLTNILSKMAEKLICAWLFFLFRRMHSVIINRHLLLASRVAITSQCWWCRGYLPFALERKSGDFWMISPGHLIGSVCCIRYENYINVLLARSFWSSLPHISPHAADRWLSKERVAKNLK